MSPADSPRPRAGYLGPEGTFSEEALLSNVDGDAIEPVALGTIREAVIAVRDEQVRWSLVPIENSVEGSVTVTLDTLVGETERVSIVGEAVLAVRQHLIAAPGTEVTKIQTIVSHPHVPGQCARFLRERLPGVRIVAATSTAEAVRSVAEQADGACAAIGPRLAAEIYGCEVIVEGVQDREDNETRFVWLARDETADAPPFSGRASGAAGGKTSLVFWGAGADRAGWLVLCLDEFARRGINLTKIESRPMRERLGHYMFFVDLEGLLSQPAVSDALVGLHELCERVRVLGSYPAA
jgi:prephenate dehydratase